MNFDNSSSDSQSSSGVSSSVMSPDTTMQENGFSDGYNSSPYLEITEQPANEFRFRYKSEMQGAHGAILGSHSNNKHGKTFPSVKLHNYTGHAIIRCTLATASGERCVHAHRLVAKIVGKDKEQEEPHDISVGPDSYEAQFQNMVIIHIEKKKVFEVLEEKMKNLRAHRSLNSVKTITSIEMNKIKEKARHCGKNMDMNQVSLKFEALRRIEYNRLEDICPAVYTIPINNLKSHERGKLKICRIDRHVGSCRGEEEVFIFVEKVSKQNIKVKFYELDGEGREIWSDYAKFGESDVHHQFGIVFRTPPYKDPGITQNVHVLICLVRPSNGGVSDPIDFQYKPDHATKKRKLSSHSTSFENSLRKEYLVPDTTTELPQDVVDFYINSELSMELPLLNEYLFQDLSINENMSFPSNPSIRDILDKLPTPDADEYMKNLSNFCSSDEFNDYVQLMPADVVTDGILMTEKYKKLIMHWRHLKENPHFKMDYLINKCTDILNRILQNKKTGKIDSLMFAQLVDSFLNHSLDEEENRILHYVTDEAHLVKLERVVKFIKNEVESKYKSNLINVQNSHKETPLHLAVKKGLTAAVTIILSSNVADLSKMDEENKTPLHYAVKQANDNTLEILQIIIDSSININENEICDEGTPLHIAIRKENNLEVVNMLLQHPDIDVNIRAGSARETPLHIAVENLDVKMVELLINKCEEYGKQLKKHLDNASGKNPINRCIELSENKSLDISNKAKIIATLLSIDTGEKVTKLSEVATNSTLCKKELTVEEDILVAAYDEENGYFDQQALNELAKVMNKNGRWKDLVFYLGYRTDMHKFSRHVNPTAFLLMYIERYGNTTQAVLHQIQEFFVFSNYLEEADIFERMMERKYGTK